SNRLCSPCTPSTCFYPLSLHDALPIYQRLDGWLTMLLLAILWFVILDMARVCVRRLRGRPLRSSSEAPYQSSRLQGAAAQVPPRSEEHTSELQSPYDLVCRLLLEKKKK